MSFRRRGHVVNGEYWQKVLIPGVWTAIVIICSVSPAAAEDVLILNSYHRGKILSDDILLAVQEEFRARRPQAKLAIEDMDTKRFSPAQVGPSLATFYRQKYADKTFAAVITVDNNALTFALEHRAQLFPGAPIIFCGVNNYQPSMIAKEQGVTGVAEAIDLPGTIDLALRLHPRTTHLAVVSDVTPTGQELLLEFRESAKAFPKSVQVVELVGLEEDVLKRRLSALPETSLVLRLTYFRSAAGAHFDVEQQIRILTAVDLPIYDSWDEGIGKGYVGGLVVTGQSQGLYAANLALRVLAGESADTIPVIQKSPNVPVFDMRALRRFDADLTRLPDEAVLRFDDPTLWEKHGRLILGVAATLVGLALVILFLARFAHRTRRLASALAESEGHMRTTLRSIADAVISTGADGAVDQMNPLAEQLTGWSLEEARGMQLPELFQVIQAENREPVKDLVETLMEGQTTLDGLQTLLLMARDGRERRISKSGAAIRNEAGEACGVILVFRDVGEEFVMQERLRHSEKLQALGQLAGGVAHDFNNVLAGIMGAAELTTLDPEKTESVLEYQTLIIDSALRASGLTKKMLAFARKQPLADAAFDVHECLTTTLALFETTVDPRIGIEVELGSPLAQVYGDKSRLQSVFLNLCINAAHAMPDGGKLSVETRAVKLGQAHCDQSTFNLEPGPFFEVEFRDTGCGMSNETMERIFEPFFTTRAPGSGSGLGLASALGTVQQHGGAVLVKSKVGSGTCFTVRVPMYAEQDTSDGTLKKDLVRGRGRVLVVDDDETIRKNLRDLLTKLDYEVLQAENGRQALAFFGEARLPIDLVMLDMAMPVMNGRDCFRALKQLDPNVLVVLSSGFISDEEVQEMKKEGLAGFLSKPFHATDLSLLLRRVMSKSEAPPE